MEERQPQPQPSPTPPTQPPPVKESKKEKPKDDWKAIAEAKKLKKEQDRQKDKQKLEQKQQEEKKNPPKPKDPKPVKQPQPPLKQQTKEAPPMEAPKPAEPIVPKPTTTEQQQVPSAIEELLPRKLKTLKSIKPDEDALRNVLLQHTVRYFHEDDSVLLASRHATCCQWFEKNACEVVDIWNITGTSTRKENIIRTRFQDVSHLLHTTTKIVCGATAIFQNGVVLSEPGTLLLAMLAHQHRIPFIVLCQTYRYCDTTLLQGDLSQQQGILYDLINPKYISMLITEAGPITVCSIPTLVSALYGL